ARDAGRSHAALDLGVEEHGEARGDPDGDGASDQRRHRAQGVGETWVLAPVQSQGAAPAGLSSRVPGLLCFSGLTGDGRTHDACRALTYRPRESLERTVDRQNN